MTIDLEAQINAVRREVGRRVLEAGEARVVTLARTYATTREDLWEACTDPDRIRRWFLPVTGELRVGGRYQLEGNAGGTIERCEPPRSFFATWEYGGAVSWIEVRLEPEGEERTRLVLEHIAHVDDHWEQFGPGAAGVGWDLALVGLGLHLAAGGAHVVAEGEAWAASEEGRAFMARSSEAWEAAHVAGGAPPAAAAAAAARTTAFYTGAPPAEEAPAA